MSMIQPFFLKDLASVKNLLGVFSYYLKYSGLKPNFSKCQIAGIKSLKDVEVVVHGIKCVNLKLNIAGVNTDRKSTHRL